MFFAGTLGASFGYVLLADRAPAAALMIAIMLGCIPLLLTVRWLQRRAGKPGRAPVGPLSRDELRVARSKLVKE